MMCILSKLTPMSLNSTSEGYLMSVTATEEGGHFKGNTNRWKNYSHQELCNHTEEHAFHLTVYKRPLKEN